MQEDIRWKQRFNNYRRALQTFVNAVQLAQSRDLSELEQQGLIQSFEFTHELAWNVLKDYLEDQGFSGLVGSKDATRMAFKYGLIEQGEAWMSMIKARNQTSHSYDHTIAQAVIEAIMQQFYPAFLSMAQKFTALHDQPDADL